MRLQPVAAMPLQRVAVQDFKLSNEMVVPAGVTIDLAQYTVMQDKTWGWKDGASFIPVSSCLPHLEDGSQAQRVMDCSRRCRVPEAAARVMRSGCHSSECGNNHGRGCWKG